MRLNLARTLARSAANGPGDRFVIWVQGCPLACPGCWNPDTWSFQRRNLRDTEELVAEILTIQGIEGVTFTGGEPFMQALCPRSSRARSTESGPLGIVFTGYNLDELTLQTPRAICSPRLMCWLVGATLRLRVCRALLGEVHRTSACIS